jgi:AraC-like DNA-binding protein
MPQVSINYQLDLDDQSTWITATASQMAKSSIAFVQELGDFIAGRNYYTRRANLPSYLIEYCISGEGILEYGGNTYTIIPGQAFWIDCEKPQYYHTSQEKGNWRALWVHMYGPSCKTYYELYLAQNDGNVTRDIDSDLAVRSTIESLIGLYKSGDTNLQDDVQASGLLTMLMTYCITSASKLNVPNRLPAYIIDARSFINLNYSEQITLDVLSKKLSINKFYIQKLFKRYMGLSPNEYLIQIRLTRAKQLLRTTNLPISQIATDVGVSNIGHFINQFKQHEGITPGGYRQRWYRSNESDAYNNMD